MIINNLKCFVRCGKLIGILCNVLVKNNGKIILIVILRYIIK